MARAELTPPAGGVTLRRAIQDDFDRSFALYEAVAAEGVWIGAEAPIDREAAARRFIELVEGDRGEPSTFLLAEVDGTLIGTISVHMERGIAGIGMLVADGWRGRGVGSILIEAALDWARDAGAHKVVLAVWPHNLPARRLYTRYGFVEEGRRRRHYRRRNRELWDAIDMGLILDDTSPGSSLSEADDT